MTAAVLFGERILQDIVLVAEAVHRHGKALEARVTLQPGPLR